MILLRLCRNTLSRLLVALVIISSLVVTPAFCQETGDSQVFIAGFNAYQQKDYASSIEKMNEVLKKYPDTPLRDMALFWLSRSYYKAGNQQEAARYLSQFTKEYPDNPLKSTVEDELLSLMARYEKGEILPTGSLPAKQPDRLAAQKEKAEKERIAAAKAEEAKRAEEAAESARIAAVKQAEENAAAEKKELARVAAEKAEQERVAAARAEEARQAAIAAAAESARVAAQKQAEEKAAAEKKEQERIAKETAEREKAEQQRIAAIKAEEARKAAEMAEQQRIAAARAEQERIAQEAAAREKAEQQRIAAIKSEEARKAAEQAEQARIAAARVEEMKRAAAEKQEQERVAALKAEQERTVQETAAREKAEQQRTAAAKSEEALRAAAAAETARIAAQAAEAERLAKIQAERERIAQAEADLARMNEFKAKNERKAAAERAERERVSLEKTEEAKQAAAAAESARMASLKASEESKAAERVAREAENSRLTALKAEEARLAEQKSSEEKTRAAKQAYREKAIAQYKAIIDKFPASTAAVTAAAKLRELGVAVALPPQAPAEAPLPENAQVLRLEVAQFAGFEFNLLARPEAFNIAKPVSVPFEIINRGNGKDSFYLESAFPADFKARFASAAAPGVAISQTPELAPGETFKGVIELVIPPASIDGLRITHPVKAASRLLAEASQSREVRLVASAPLLRAVLRTEKTRPLPGEKVVYRIAILNIGSTAAQDVTFRLNFPPQFEPVDYVASGFRLEMKSALVLDGLQINSGESREFSVTFQLKDDSLAGQELLTRAELINNPLKTTAAFVSNIASVESQRSILVRAGSDRLVVIPGQTITVPFVVTNTGNVREKFRITSIVTGAQDAVIFNDLNRDGIHQASEPVISEIGPLAPREEANVIVELKTPRNSADGSQGGVQLSFVSEGDAARSASGSTLLTYSRPVLKMVMTGSEGRLKPGDVASFDLAVTNNGSNLSRVVELQSAWPEQLELVAAEPAASAVTGGALIWRFKEMGAGEKRNIKVSFRVKPGTGVGTAIRVKNILTYEDQLGNRY
ncbi:MAG TPA: tetratricopeptide repeat protein [Dongiaceae bacterium]|nr:tetratricopeptide repeat protein [Dongiaceae bacterium]